MPRTTKLSVSLPSALLARADHLLTRPGEGRSALLARVLDEAVRAAEEAEIDAKYERAYGERPISPHERRVLNAFSRASLGSVLPDAARAGD